MNQNPLSMEARSALQPAPLLNWWYRHLMLLLMLVAGMFSNRLSAQSYAVIGSGATTTNGNGSDPVDDYFKWMHYQTVYTASELSAAGILGGSQITGLGFSVSEDNGAPFPTYTVRLAHTNSTNSAADDPSPLTTVFGPASYDPAVTAAGVFDMITFTTPFVWNGTSNILVDICTGSSAMAYASPYGGVRADNQTNGSRSVRSDTGNNQCSVATTTTNANRPQIRFAYTDPPLCSGTPTAGSIPATSTTCIGNTVTLTQTGGALLSGFTYQWLQSPNGISSWAPVSAGSGANTKTYTTAPFSVTAYYRLVVTCTGSGLSDSTNVATINAVPAPPYAVFDGVSYNQGFESWSNRCNTTDVPSVNWQNTPGTGLNSWRRNDQGASAGWASSSGSYTPASQAGSYSARFHSVEAPNGSQGSLDLYIDMSAATGNTKLKFGYINADGSDIMDVRVSTDGGATFTSLSGPIGQQVGWADKEYTLTSTSATTVIRFRATSDLGTSDIGLDNLRIFTPCSGAPSVAAASATPATVCSGNTTVITATGTGNPATGINFQWEQSPDGVNGWVPVTGGSGATTTTYTTPGLLVTTYYRLNQSCSYSGLITYSNVVTVAINTPAYATYNNISFSEDFENWTSSCNTNDAPSASWRVNPYSGNNSWRRDDQGVSGAGWASNTGAYTPVFTTGAHSARFHTYNSTSGLQGSLDLFINMTAATGPTRLSFDYINTSGTDVLAVLLSTDGGQNFTQVGSNLGVAAAWANKFFDFNSNSATTVVRLLATSDYGGTDMGVDNLLLAPAPSCITPLNLTATIASLNSVNLSWNASVSNPSGGYDWEARTSGTGGSGPAGLQASGSVAAGITTAVATPLLQDSTYTFYVRANCGGGNYSIWGASSPLYFGYCKPAPSSIQGTGITNVAFGTLSNTTGAETNNYGNYTALTGGDVQQTLNANVAITYATGATYGTKIWVDWNNDLDFADAGELVYTGLSAATNPTTLNASFNVGTHTLGSYRMRIGGTNTDSGPSGPCYTGTQGAFEDYTLNVTAPPSCIAPTGLSVVPAPTSVSMAWVASTSNPTLGYQWEVRASGAPGSGASGLESTGIATGGDTSATSGTIPSDATHYVYVRAICSAGDSSAWIGPVSTYNGYCAAAGNNTSYYINDFSTTNGFAEITNFGTGYSAGGYGNFTAQAVADTAGGSVNFSAVFGSGSNTFHFRIWVDWNQDFDFDDAGEQLFDGTVYQTNYTGSITVPPGTPYGNYRMRIHNTYTGTPAACGTSNGETEDYVFSVVPPPACYAPVATTTIQEDCGNSQFYIGVDLTSLGDASSVDIQSDYAGNPGGVTAATVADTTYVLGPFADLSTVNIVVVHNGNSICNDTLAPVTFNCAWIGRNALSFDGTDDNVEFGASPTLNITGSAITLEAWIYPTAWRTSSFQGSIINKEGPNSGYMIRCGNNGQLSFNLGDGNGLHEIQSATGALTLNTWQHVAATYDGVTERLFINGVQVASSAAAFNIGTTTYVLRLGSSANYPDRTFPGKIDEVRIWNKAIPAATLLANMNTAYCGNEAGLVGYYKFDQGTDSGDNTGLTTLNDGSLYGNNGTLNNFALTGSTSNWVQGQTNMGDCVPVACLAPTAITVLNISATSADLKWTSSNSAPANGYQWEVRSSGVGGSGATGLADSGTTATALDTTANSSVLAPNTAYSLYVRSDCGAGQFSDWAGPFYFSTPCASATVPYTEGFDGVTTPAIPACMKIQTVSGNPWTTVAAPTGYSGNVARVSYTSSGSPDMDSWIFTQGINLNAGTSYQLLYKYGNNSTSYAEALSVSYGLGQNEAGMTTQLVDHASIDDNTPHLDTLAFTPATSGVYYIGFKCHSIADQFYLYLDDILVRETPVCYAPSAMASVIPDCANNQFYVGVNLTDLGDASSVGIESDYAGNPGGVTSTSVVDSTYVIGPFADLSTVNITVVHNDTSLCNLVLDPVTYDCSDYGKNALSFDGSNDRVDCGDNASVNITGNALTMEAWVYPTAWKANVYQGDVINKESSSGGGLYTLRTGNGGRVNVALGGSEVTTSTAVLSLDVWQHLAATYDGDTVRIFVNGTQVYRAAHTGSLAASPGYPLCIGNSFAYPDRGFVGKIDEVRIWKKVIPPATLLANMNTAYCGNENGLVAYYQFDQGTAAGTNTIDTVLNDLTGYANNGILKNFALTGATSNWVVGVTPMGACVPVACATPINVSVSNVMATSVDLGWTNTSATNYEYEIRTSGEAGSGATGLAVANTAASGSPAFTVPGLSATTSYTFYVRADCGGGAFSEWSTGVPFTTPCNPVAIPYSEDFESVVTPALPLCMSRQSVNGPNWVTTSAPTGMSGTAAYAYGYSTPTSNTSTWLYTAGLSLTGGTTYRVTYKYSNQYNYYTDALKVAYGSFAQQSAMTNVLIDHATINDGLTHQDVVDFTPATTGVYYIGFQKHSPSANYGYYMYVDDISVDLAPACLEPIAPVVSNVSFTTANLSWTASPSAPANGYNWEVRDGAANVLASGSTLAGVTTDMATGLPANTTLTLYVTANCGTGNQSAAVASAPFYTGYCIPAPSSQDNNGITNVTFSGINNTTGSEPGYYGDYTALAGGDVQQTTVATVSITYQTGYTYGTKIWVDWNNNLSFSDPGEQVYYGLSTNANPTTLVATFSVGAAPLGSYRMRIGGTDNDSGPNSPCYTGSYGTFEDYTLTITAPPACPTPAGLAVGNITATSANLSWTENGSASYDYEVRTSGAAGSGASGLALSGNVAGSPVALALAGNTSYTAYVRSSCAGPDSSEWSVGVPFTTPCNPVAVPYSEDFESAVIPALPTCMANQTIQGPTWVTYGSAPTGMSGQVARCYDYVTVDSWLYTAGLNLTGGTTYRLTYKYTNQYNFYVDGLRVAYGTSATNSAMLDTLIVHPAINDGTVHTDVVDFTPATTGVYYIGFQKYSNSSTDDAYMYLDDISVIVTPSCEAPTALVASNITPTSATFNWTASTSNPSNGYIWEVRTSGAAGSGPAGLVETGTTAAGVTTASTTVTLTSGTTYQVYVRGDCGGGGLSSWSSGISFTAGTTQIGTGTSTNTYFPIYTCYGYNYSQQIYLASELGAMQPYITKIAFKYVNGADDATDYKNWVVYLGNTAQTGFGTSTSWIPLASLSQVFSGVINPVAGQWMVITLDTPFLWNGTSNLVVAVDENTPSYECTANWQSYAATGSNRGILYYSDGTNPDPASPPAANQRNSNLAQVKIYSEGAPPCFPPSAYTTVQPDCGNGQYFVEVHLTNLGDATSVGIQSDYPGNPGGVAATSVVDSAYVVGPFADLSTVNITLVHNDTSLCNVVLDPVTYDCSDYGKNALSFDGVNDRVSLGNPASLAITGTHITLEAWIYPTSWRAQSYQGNIINTESNDTKGYMLRCGANGTLSFNLGDGSNWHEVLSAAGALSLNTWQHVAGTYDGTTQRLYINGVQVAATTGSFNIGYPNNSVVIGDWSNGTGRNFPGLIDEVRVWNKTVSAASLASHLHTAYCGNETGLVGYYQFDQGVAYGNNAGVTTLNDLTANANNGTLSGFALNGFTSNWVPGQTDLGDCVPVTCQVPIGLAASANVHSVNLSWTNNGAAGYSYEIRTSGNPGSGATGLVASGTASSGSPAFNVGGLTSSTTYTVYVMANCGGANGNSEWSAGVTFTTGAACGDGFTDTGGAGGNYGNNENWVKTYCATTPGNQTRVLFSSFYTEANWDKLFVFNGPDVNSPKFASTSDAGYGNTTYGAGGWSGDLSSALPGPFTSSNTGGCLTFAFVSDGGGTYAGWNAITQCVEPNNTCDNATPVLCGNVYSGSTGGVPHNMPANTCPYNGAGSTGGQNWWQYTATSDAAVTFSTCGAANFDTRISVFSGSDCNNLSCVAMNDDGLGCANGSSDVLVNVTTGTTYWIAVHGAGAAEGDYTLTVSCGTVCTPPTNDQCANATALTNGLADGSGTPTTYTNECATVDAPTNCSGALPVQGVWFTFNSGNYSHALFTLVDNGDNAQYTATTLDYARFSGDCGGLGAGGSIGCTTDGSGVHVMNVVPQTTYRLLVSNTGGVGVAGTFGLMVEHPALNDASITAILSPASGLLCGSSMAPQVTLLNNGDVNLTSVQITYGLSGGASHVYNWTGNLAYGQSVNVTLPTVVAEAGVGQTLTVATSMPNGVADEIAANDSQGISLDVGGEPVVVNIFTDNNASGLNWQIYDADYNVVAQNGTLGNNTLVSEYHCLSTASSNCYLFYLTDAYGDGLCCANGNGYWELRTPAGGLLLRDLFDASVDGISTPTSTPASPSYGFGHSFCLPAGSASITATECGIFTNLPGNKVFCNKVTGATQYQFEFSDPDAGFMRRIVRTINYVHFNDMVANPLVPGVHYFARVRTNVAGPIASAHFGTGCETGLAPTVPCTQLIMAPLYGHSCNETRAFNPPTNNSFIYATPVVGAGQYQFRIFNTSEGYNQTFTRSTYILQLKWNNSVAPMLVNGSTYNVEVRANIGGVWGNFCPSTCTITIDNSGGSGFASMEQTSFGDASMWPNPVRDGQVNLSIGGLKDADQRITVDVQDIYGKQVFAQEFGNSGDRFNTILQLPKDIASGVYMVNITVNGVKTVQRLSVVR
jgi:hypothetical protein